MSLPSVKGFRFIGCADEYRPTGIVASPMTDTSIVFRMEQLIIPSVTIGTQVWMVLNLDVTTYRNGDPIPQVTDPRAWPSMVTGAWCYYDNDSVKGAIYGKLYNWYAVNDPRGLAPVGWHVASDDEWARLTAILGGKEAGGQLKEAGTSHWFSPNTGANNYSRFTALPGGYRYTGGTFSNLGSSGIWWSASEWDPGNAGRREMYYSSAAVGWIPSTPKYCGFSVRCVRD